MNDDAMKEKEEQLSNKVVYVLTSAVDTFDFENDEVKSVAHEVIFKKKESAMQALQLRRDLFDRHMKMFGQLFVNGLYVSKFNITETSFSYEVGGNTYRFTINERPFVED